MRFTRSFVIFSTCLATLAVLASPGPAPGQDSTSTDGVAPHESTRPVFDTRAELVDRRERLEARLGAAESGSEASDSLRRELRRVERRLTDGDFRPGDIVEIQLPSYDTLSGRFQVGPERNLELPTLGALGLSGVLYAEADSVIASWLREYVRANRVQVRVLQRVAVLGEVRSPGFYDLSPATPLSGAVMAAGGPTQNSALDEIEIRRDGATIVSGEESPLKESASLEDLGVERGDQIFVPGETQGFGVGSVISAIGAIGTLSFALSRIF